MSADYASCKDCGRRWSGYSECHCRKRHRHFSTIRAFDAHFAGNEHQDPPLQSEKGRPLFKSVERASGMVWVGASESLPSHFSRNRNSLSDEKAVSV